MTTDCCASTALMPPNVILIGLMGCGKTTVGRIYARRSGRDFLDSDVELVKVTGVEISTIFEIEGEAAFRDREELVLADLVKRQNVLIATGGGAVVRTANRVLLQNHGIVVYLHASPEIVWGRMRGHKGRPLLANNDPLSTLKQLYTARDHLYRETAHHIVEIRDEAPASVALHIESLMDTAIE
jgi:shikimate kinase